MIKKILPAILFSCLLLFPATGLAQFDYNSKQFQSVVSKLDMQGHSKDDLSTCSVKQTYYKEVAEMLNDGMSEQEIINYYVDQYGQAALKEPGLNKNGLIAWVMPVAGFAAGVFIVVGFWLKRIKGKNRSEAETEINWESENEKAITGKIFDEERRKQF